MREGARINAETQALEVSHKSKAHQLEDFRYVLDWQTRTGTIRAKMSKNDEKTIPFLR